MRIYLEINEERWFRVDIDDAIIKAYAGTNLPKQTEFIARELEPHILAALSLAPEERAK